jgi:hypothetical protein
MILLLKNFQVTRITTSSCALSVEARLCRWLLVSQDLLESEKLR